MLVGLVVLFAVSHILERKYKQTEKERQKSFQIKQATTPMILQSDKHIVPCRHLIALFTNAYLVFPAGSTYVVRSSFTHFPTASTLGRHGIMIAAYTHIL